VNEQEKRRPFGMVSPRRDGTRFGCVFSVSTILDRAAAVELINRAPRGTNKLD